MNHVQRSTQTTGEAIEWYRTFFEAHGRLPGVKETENLRGPTWRLLGRVGGLPGVAAKLNLEPTDVPKRTVFTDHQLTQSLSSWVLQQGTDKPPLFSAANRAFRSSRLPVASADTYSYRFGNWDNALAETGFFRFNWSASECVASAARARTETGNPDLRKALRQQGQPGVSPTLTDVLGHYPDLRELSSERLNWKTWDQPSTNWDSIKRRTINTVSYGILALAFADGEMGDFEQAHEILHKEDRGPEFSKSLYTRLAPHNMDETARYVWALDFIEGAHDVLILGDENRRLPLGGLQPSIHTRQHLLNPIFVPEINELRAA